MCGAPADNCGGPSLGSTPAPSADVGWQDTLSAQELQALRSTQQMQQLRLERQRQKVSMTSVNGAFVHACCICRHLTAC